MKRFIRILFLLACLTLTSRAEIPADWSTNTNAISGKSGSKQPVLVFFTASWCQPCKLMTRLTLTNNFVKQVVTNLTHIAVDIDDHPDLAQKYGIDGVPTFVLLSDNGTEVRRTSGFQPASDFLRWLTNGVTEAQAAIVYRAECQKKLAAVDQLIASTETDSFPQAATLLFDLCAERDESISHAAADRLKTVAAHDPAALSDGLADARLATRIQVANALHDRLGEKFDFDPWDNLADRSKSAQQWRANLAQKEPLERTR
jgi:thioredoxin-like negative regulator of GroEL